MMHVWLSETKCVPIMIQVKVINPVGLSVSDFQDTKNCQKIAKTRSEILIFEAFKTTLK
jgi:hypothetical protein